MKTSPWLRGTSLAVWFASCLGSWAAPLEAEPTTNAAGLKNLDFELGAPGQTPPGWFVPKVLAAEGFAAILTTNQPRHGQQCVEIRWPEGRAPSPGVFANLMQRVDAAPLRGKQIRVTAAIRVAADKPASRAQMWLRVDRPGGMGAFDNMNDRPVFSADWADYSITADVAEDARALNLGLITYDGATAWWDDVRCEVLAEFKTRSEPPRPLSETGLRNLVALSRLVGYVRHFHPSDQAASNDWLAFVVTALPQVESAGDSAALAARLDAVFRPIAPTVRVFQTGQAPPLPVELVKTSDAAPPHVRVWEHNGYAQSPGRANFVYSSERLSLEAGEVTALPVYARPTNVFRAELAPGVACLVPTAVFADERGTLPHVESSAAGPDSGTRFSVAHRGARLATVMLAWNVLQQFYPYFDVIDTDWAGELDRALRKAATDADEAAFYETLNRLITALQDGHGTLNGPGMPQQLTLPVRIELVETQLVVTALAPEFTNLQTGDVIERVDGIPAWEAFQKLAREVSAATPQRRNQVAFRLGAGPPGSSATLEVRGADNALRRVTLERTIQPRQMNAPRPPAVNEIRPGLFYVDLTRVSDAEFQAALPRLAQARGIVFDVRGYPAGSTDWLTHLSTEPLRSARWNIAKQHRPDRTDLEWVTSGWTLQPAAPCLTTNRVFLTDGSAISYAETVMGIVEAYRLGAIVGEPTAGTNGNIVQTDLPLGYRMIWTGMQVLKHDGSRHHGVGIRPTVPVSRTVRGIREGRDEQLERALALLAPEL